ncbi:MAG TPA: hypothetical protein DCL29_05440 [Eubacterium sp.]|nr:hypothetical protein [Eubacterium sp.]
MSYKHLHFCDICGKEIKNTDCYYTVTKYPSVKDDWTIITDICNDCITKFSGFEAFNGTEIDCEEEQRSAE